MSATARRDYAPWEVGAAFLVAACVQLSAFMVLYFTRSNSVGAVAETDKGTQLPVKVQPVLDLEGQDLKLGGKKPVLPDMWAAPPKPAPNKAPDETAVSTKADQETAPEKDKKVAPPDADIPPPDAETSDEPRDAAKTDEKSDADPLASSEKAPGTNSEGSDQGIQNGTALEVNAANLYHTRVSSFLNRQVQVSCGSGESKSTGVTVVLSGTSITSASAGGTGDAEFDAAVKGAIAGLVGQSIPPPPDQYPQFLKPSFAFTVKCH